MSFLSENNPLYKRVMEIFNKSAKAIFQVNLHFTNMNNESLNMEIEHLNRIDIVHDFFNNCMEMIEIDFQVNVPQLQTLLKWFNELKCNLVINYYDDIKNEVKDTCFKCSYRVLIPNMQDITQSLSAHELYDKDDVDKDMTFQKRGQMVNLKAQLIKPDTYALAKLKMNTILHNATVEQALWTFAQIMKIKKCAIYPPDNKNKYPNLKIPPMKSLFNIFNFLQTGEYGIYNNHGGLYYHNDECLYVFPCFVPEGKSKDTFHIYKTPPGFLLSATGTTIYENEDTFIFSNQLMTHSIISVKELEDRGNSLYTLNSNKLFNNWGAHSESGTKFSDDNADVFNSSFGKGAMQQTHNPNYEFNNNNECMMKSKLSPLGVSTIDIGWAAAIPFSIKPFQKVLYHYDHQDKQKTLKCTCPSISYTIKREIRFKKPLFTCFASIKLFTKDSTDELE